MRRFGSFAAELIEANEARPDGARGSEPPGPTPQIVLPAFVSQALAAA